MPPNRHRDRRGRGPRGPLAPPPVPLGRSRSRSDQFDDLVLDAVERLERRWSDRLSGVEFAVEEVPATDPPPWAADPVPLARLFPAHANAPARVVLYRRPIEARAEPRDVGTLVHHVVVEQVAQLLGLSPQEVDPRWEEPDA